MALSRSYVVAGVTGAVLVAIVVMSIAHLKLSSFPRLTEGGGQTGAAVGMFDSYGLAQTWGNGFCSGASCDKQECKSLPGSYGETHLILHGLWPNYNVASEHSDYAYPQYCGTYANCESLSAPSSCLPDMSNLNYQDFAKYGPGYVMDDNFLANHEWPKHGSCTGLSQKDFFAAMLALEEKLEIKAGHVWAGKVGSSVSLSDVYSAYGGKEWVSLSCTDRKLQQVLTCWDKDANGAPTVQIKCPSTIEASNCPDFFDLPAFGC